MSKIKKNWEKKKVTEKIDKLLTGFDDGELFVEEVFSENILFDDNKIKTSSFDQDKGFGLRAVKQEELKFYHSSNLCDDSLNKAIKYVNSFDSKKKILSTPVINKKTNRLLYSDNNPINLVPLNKKIIFLKKINKYARSLDSSIKQVSISLNGNFQNIEVTKKDGAFFHDSRPLVRMNINLSVEKKGKTESGSFGIGGRYMYDKFFSIGTWKKAVDDAFKQALTRLEAIETPAGEQTVVLGPGWPGILLHEAIGHGLEGDFNRKKTSAFHNLVGKKVASDQVTVVDDGTIPDKRGSLTIDDEGTPSQNTVLIENGILKGFMQDRHNARLMKEESTGNGRRQSYSNIPMPRMTNTYMLNGKYTHEEIIKSTKKGVYASQFSGGQVDITSGKFVFSASEAYEIKDGKIGKPLKGATLIGNGPEALKEVSMVGNNLELDQGIGTCGKDGQSVPVGVGQPSLKINKLTVGGTK
ncbi:MAG: Metalloprotease TldD [Alphaproteobacteria bacterium MarineAlpha8_Bin1]|nr:MAG: Metalloprotease TldD [Alphaproteobacteria bacterium MarineAlpha8_Bin1]